MVLASLAADASGVPSSHVSLRPSFCLTAHRECGGPTQQICRRCESFTFFGLPFRGFRPPSKQRLFTQSFFKHAEVACRAIVHESELLHTTHRSCSSRLSFSPTVFVFTGILDPYDSRFSTRAVTVERFVCIGKEEQSLGSQAASASDGLHPNRGEPYVTLCKNRLDSTIEGSLNIIL